MSEPEKAAPRPNKLVIGLFVGFILLVLALIAIPNKIDPNLRRTPPDRECANNLQLINGAKVTWALDRNKSPADVPTWTDISPYMSRDGRDTNIILKCPSGGVYTLGAVSNKPTCSIPGHVLP